jgi:DnaK suppressor protein
MRPRRPNPASQGERPLTDNRRSKMGQMAVDVVRFRDLLLDERQKVLDAIDYLQTENSGSLKDETEEATVDNHLADTATVTLDREIDYTLEENSEQVLKAIDRALAKIETGTFGTCETCGQPIAEERLMAIPYATQCIDCRRREERG